MSKSYIESNLLEEEDDDPQKKKSVLDKYNVQEKNLGQVKVSGNGRLIESVVF